MSIKLDWPAGYDRIFLDRVDSTMAEARRRAPDLAGPTWILAREQTAAQGRRGRAWVNPAGNFAATLFLRPEASAAQAAQRSFVASLALFQALKKVAPGASLALKWPNDVLLNMGKVAGILLESAGQGAKVDWLAIGIGVNLIAAPGRADVEEGAVPPVSVKSETGVTLAPEAFLAALAHSYASGEETIRTQGFDPIRQLWLQHATRLGETITARTARDEFTGTFDTIDEAGQLVLQTTKGRVIIPAAEVSF